MTEVGLRDYFREALSWESERLGAAQRSARRAWWVAGLALAVVLSLTACLLVLLPLKRTEPYLIRVDNSTGVVDVVPVYAGNATATQSVTRYFLSHYVSVCERFNFATAESDYEECGAFHAAQRNQAWYALWNPSNPNSPLNLHKDGSTVRVQVQAVSFFRRGNGIEDLAQVRYLKAERAGNAAGAASERFSHWIATIQYAYGPPSQDPGVRRWNPLGFKVVELTSEPEAPQAAGNSG